jgi:hypothetical protein
VLGTPVVAGPLMGHGIAKCLDVKRNATEAA